MHIAKMDIKTILAMGVARCADSDLLSKSVAKCVPVVEELCGAKWGARTRHYPVSLLRMAFPRYGLTDNLHCLGLDARVDYLLNSVGTKPKRPLREASGADPLRIGFVGALSANLSTPPSLFSGFPREHKLFVYDIAFLGEHYADFTGIDFPSVTRFNLEKGEKGLAQLAKTVVADRLDVLFVAHHDYEQRRDLIDLVDVPYVVNFSTGSVLSNHPKVDATIFVQPRKDFYVKDGELYSSYIGGPMGGEPCWEGSSFFDRKNVSAEDNPSWEERPPNVFFHGRLHKLESHSFLEIIERLLRDHRSVRLLFAGSGESAAFRIQKYFKDRNLAGRVEYLGEFTHDHGGESTGWNAIKQYLYTARLAPNPWPIGGGSARLEAYATGVPQVHLGMQCGEGDLFDTKNQTVVDVPNLNTRLGTVSDPELYLSLCRKCLFEKGFAEALIEEQYQVASRCTDSEFWWDEKIGFYRKWLEGKDSRDD